MKTFPCLALVMLVAVAVAQPYHLGISTDGSQYAARPFADMLKIDARPWLPGTTNAAPVDARGWPTADCDLFVLDGGFVASNRMGSYAGTYRLRFIGQADIPGGWGFTLRNKQYNPTTNVTTAELIATETHPTLMIQFRNTRRDPQGATNTGIASPSLMRPITPGSTESYPPGTVFTNEFLASNRRGKVLRFMDFTATNGNIVRQWADRPHVEDIPYNRDAGNGYWWQGRGAPWEHAILLCNLLDKDLWVNVPTLADDDYVVQLAKLIKQNLEPERKVYVEYSNEPWNFGFPQWTQISREVDADLAAIPNSTINYDGKGTNQQGQRDYGILVPRFWARRVLQISDIFRAEFGAPAMLTRVRPLFETQAAWQHWISTGLVFLDGYYNNGTGNHLTTPRPIATYIWGAGGSAYLHGYPAAVKDNPNSTVDDILNGYDQAWAEHFATMARDTAWCAAFGLKRVAYESGPGLDDHAGVDSSIQRAQRDPRMKAIYRRVADEFFRAGGELFVTFLSVNPAHGLLPFDSLVGTQPRPKQEAFDEMDAAAERPAPTFGFPVPGPVPAGRYHVREDGWSTGNSDNPINFGNGYAWLGFALRTTQDGNLTVKAVGTGVRVRVEVNGSAIGELDLPSDATLVAPRSVRGMQGVRVVRISGTGSLTRLDVGITGPTIASVSPSSFTVGTPGATLTVTGTGFESGAVVRWNGTNRATTFDSSTQVRATLSSADLAVAGNFEVRLQNPGNALSNPVSVGVGHPLPVLTSVSPTSIPVGNPATTVILTGSGFNASSVARWNGAARPTVWVGPTSLRMTLAPADLALATVGQVTVANPTPGGGISAARSVTVANPVPILTSLTPASAVWGSGSIRVRVLGSRFVRGAVVRFGGSNRSTTFLSPSELSVVFPYTDFTRAANVAVTVANPAPGGGTSGALTFVVANPFPRLASLTPGQVPTKTPGATVTVRGTGFCPTSVVQWETSPRATTYVSPTEVRVRLTATDLARPGKFRLRVVNPGPGGGISADLPFAVGGVNLTATAVLRREGANVVATFTLRNQGDWTATNVRVSSASLSGSTLLTRMPLTLPNLPPGGTVSVRIAFRPAIFLGARVRLLVGGSHSSGTFSFPFDARMP